MDDQTPNPTTRMDTPEGAAAGVGTAPPPPAAPPTAPPLPPPPPGTPPPPPTTPAWEQPQRRRQGGDGGRWWSLALGLVILAVGLWFFAERTLGIEMPDIRWSQLWPVILIVIGVVVLAGAMRRDRR